MDKLQGECIYCTVAIEKEEQGQLHAYSECTKAQADGCEFAAYKQWREGINFGQAKHCWECGLSQSICRRLEQAANQQVACEYADIMLPTMFILHQQQNLRQLVKGVGFQGTYDSEDLWEWLNRTAEGWGREWESNWIATWMLICQLYIKIAKAEGEAWACK